MSLSLCLSLSLSLSVSLFSGHWIREGEIQMVLCVKDKGIRR